MQTSVQEKGSGRVATVGRREEAVHAPSWSSVLARASDMAASSLSPGLLTAPRVLLVDDSGPSRLSLRQQLDGLGLDILEADSAAQALHACRHHEFALILLDVQMPVMDGFEMAAALAEDRLSRETPIIFLTTGQADELSRFKGYQFGVADYLQKPLDASLLLAKVRVFLDLWRGRQQLRQLLDELAERNRKLEEEVAERRRVETLVRHQAQHDALTGLPNRILFLDRLDTAIERAARHHDQFALLYIDIDGFKPINDNYGHPVGDDLLRQIAQRLHQGVRKTDTVARLGGDEFTVILEEIANERAALQVALKLCELLGQPYSLPRPDGLVTVRVGASIGISIFPDHGRRRDELIHAADCAMYRAKRGGKNHALLAEAPQANSAAVRLLLSRRGS